MYVTDISDRIDPFPISQASLTLVLPFVICMRAGAGLLERGTTNGYGYYIPFITVSLFISSQLLLNETIYFILITTAPYLSQCIS